jgi:signal transduction histidine kinase
MAQERFSTPTISQFSGNSFPFLSSHASMRVRLDCHAPFLKNQVRPHALLYSREKHRSLNQKLENFSSIVAHDLKNPLSSISLNTDLILKDPQSPDIRKRAQSIKRVSKRMNE